MDELKKKPGGRSGDRRGKARAQNPVGGTGKADARLGRSCGALPEQVAANKDAINAELLLDLDCHFGSEVALPGFEEANHLPGDAKQ